MFQHTVDRADMLTPPERRVTVAAQSHREEVLGQLDSRRSGTIAFQPENRDTAAGVFLALTYVRAREPEALVAVFPSDHFVFPDDTFAGVVRSAVRALDTWRGRIVLLGSVPDYPETDYGWIQPGEVLGWSDGRPVRAVQSFVEKPCEERARRLMSCGALWNALVLAARLETLWTLGRIWFPEEVALFERLQSAISRTNEPRVLDEIYHAMPRHNFSSDLLARTPEHVAVIELRDILWSDWGRPERVAGVLSLLGKQPRFTQEHMQAS